MTDSIEIRKKVELAMEKMPSISPSFNKLMELAKNIETSPNDLVRIIMLDPVLTAKVIKLVNSAFYGLRNPVRSLADAVLYLGLNTVKTLAMSTAALDRVMVKGSQSPLDADDFWKHCLATAVAGRMLAKSLQVPAEDQEIYFLSGLLHDLGKVLYIQAVPEVYGGSLRVSQESGRLLVQVEKEMLEGTHSEMGGILARKWKLDAQMVEAIDLHHGASEVVVNSKNQVLQLVVVANNLCKCHALGNGGDISRDEGYEEVIAKLGFQQEHLKEIADKLPQELERASKFLGIQS